MSVRDNKEGHQKERDFQKQVEVELEMQLRHYECCTILCENAFFIIHYFYIIIIIIIIINYD